MPSGYCLQKPFLREATGLVREMGLTDVLTTAALNMSVGMGVLWLLVFGPGVAPGGDLVLGTVIICVLMTVGSMSWVFLATAMPRSGGDYVFLGRVLYPAIGVGTSAVWYFANILFGGMGAAWVPETGIPSLAYSINRPDIAAMATTPPMLIGVGTLVLAIEAAMLIVSLKLYLRFQLANFVIGMIMLVAVLVVVGTSTNAQFIQAFNAFSAQYKSPNYNSILSSGASQGYTYTSYSAAATMAVLPAGYWALGYAYFSTYMAGEIKNAHRNISIGVIAANVLTGLIMCVSAYIFVQVMGYNFLGAVSAAWSSGAWTVPNPPYFHILAGMLVSNNPGLLILFGVGMICWNLVTPGLCLWGMSRILLAWSFDRLAPSAFGSVSEKFHTPHKAIIISFALCEALLIIYAFYYQLFEFFTSEVMQAATSFMLIAIAAALFPFLKKTRKLYEMSVVSKYRIGRIPIMTICGIVYAFTLLTVLYYFVGPVYGELHTITFLETSSVMIGGIIAWFAIRAYRKREGIDMMLAYKDLPPE
jgi:amino acid transporter